ncbi:MAG: hypothetical protein HGB23_06790 [Chlorobiaceae bacterium]|nr:hypothetical protein [Chlorobiaceae bacterium]
MNNSGTNEKIERYCRDMTVANIRSNDEADFVEIVFLESARFYRIMKKNSNFNDMLGKLETALSDSKRVTVGLDSIESEIIEDVR